MYGQRIRSEVSQPFRVIGNTSRIVSTLLCVLGLANCQLGTAEELLLLLHGSLEKTPQLAQMGGLQTERERGERAEIYE